MSSDASAAASKIATSARRCAPSKRGGGACACAVTTSGRAVPQEVVGGAAEPLVAPHHDRQAPLAAGSRVRSSTRRPAASSCADRVARQAAEPRAGRHQALDRLGAAEFEADPQLRPGARSASGRPPRACPSRARAAPRWPRPAAVSAAVRPASGWPGAATITSSSSSQGRTTRSGWVCGPSMKPTSTSNPATAAITSLVLPMRSCTGLAGWPSRSTARYQLGQQVFADREAGGDAQRRRVFAAEKPPAARPPARAAHGARGSSARPFSLSTSRRPTRSNSATPSAVSSSASDAAGRRLRARDAVGGRRACEPPRAVATNTSSWRRFRRRRGSLS